MTQNKRSVIGLFGFGVVGEGIYQVLQNTPGLDAEVKNICIRDGSKKRNAPQELFTCNRNLLLDDPEINVIVELIDDPIAAFEIVCFALKNGKAVVSANKKMIADNIDTLLALQREYKVPFLYEAAVCGSIPVIRNLEEYYDNDLLKSFQGIVNGSTNFILTQIHEHGLDYASALAQAQSLGFAESNPSLDVEGFDAVNKLSIILLHAYGVATNTQAIPRKGITSLHASDSKYANEKGKVIRLVAHAELDKDGQLAAWVLPEFVDRTSQLFSVRNEFNGVLLGSSLADTQFLYGKGAGRFPTATAVLSDIAALRYDYRYEYKKLRNAIKGLKGNSRLLNIYVSFRNGRRIPSDNFTLIEQRFESNERCFITGWVQLDILAELEWFHDPEVSVILYNSEEWGFSRNQLSAEGQDLRYEIPCK